MNIINESLEAFKLTEEIRRIAEQKEPIPFEWEFIPNRYNDTARAKVIGGWLVKEFASTNDTPESVSIALVFIPDTHHLWQVKK